MKVNRRVPSMSETLTQEQLDALVDVLADPEAAAAFLSPEERQRYEDSLQSVVDARRYAERHAHEYWVG